MLHGKCELMKILITGGTGFLGGRIVKHFLNQEHIITLASRTNAPYLEWCKGVRIVAADWSDMEAIRSLCSGQDIIIHAAGMNAQECITNPAYALYFNGVVTAQMAKAAAENGVKKFIFLSTAHVYSAPLCGIVSEGTCAKNNHPYAFSKRAGEQAVLFVQQQNAMDGMVLRLSNVFGAPAHTNVNVWTLLVNDLCKQAVTSGKMTLNTAGIQYRDFLPMESFLHILSGIIYLNGKSYSEPVFNVGSGQSLTILEMAQLIQIRYENLFHDKIMLDVPKEVYEGSPVMSFNFLVDKIKKAGIFSSSELTAAIDEVLIYCKKNFS